MKIKRKYNYFYKITNNINGFYYYGVHSTDDLEDGYMGSGSRLRIAYKEFGMDKFSKEILKFFDTREEAFEYESRIVTEDLVFNTECYNSMVGGGYSPVGLISVVDKDGKTSKVYENDPRYISGELVPITTGKIPVKDSNGNFLQVDIDDPRYISGELVSVNKGMISVKNKDGVYLQVRNDDPRYISGELVPVTKGMIAAKDNTGRFFQVSVDDPRYISGELVGVSKGYHLSDESKRKIGNANSIRQSGTLNSQYGKCWIKNDKLKLSKSIKKEDLDKYISDGWVLGRTLKWK